MTRITLAALAILAGCAGNQQKEVTELETHYKQTSAIAQAGDMKWSDVYRDMFSRVAKLEGTPGKANTLQVYSQLITAAENYEQGRITRTDFEGAQRAAFILAEQGNEQQRAQATQAMSRAVGTFGNAVYGPEATKARQIQPAPASQQPRQIQCQTYGTQTICQ